MGRSRRRRSVGLAGTGAGGRVVGALRAVRFVWVVALAAGLVVVLALPASAAALEQKLIAADGAAGDRLGASVAVEGDTAVVGAPEDEQNAGAVYVFTRLGDGWSETAKLTAADGATGDRLGVSVAIDGDTIVAGAPSDDVGANPNQGSVYTFARTGAAARNQTAKLTATDGAADDALGFSVAIDGDTVVAGAYLDDVGANPNQGSVYTFARTGAAARDQSAKLTATDGTNDFLGDSVAIDGDTIVASAPFDDVGANVDQGSVYTFARTGAPARTQTAKLTATDGATNDFLGDTIAIDGDTIVASAPFDDVGANPNQGSVYTFARTGAAARNQTAKLTATDGAASDLLGFSVAIDGDTVVAGALFDDVGANENQGSASIFYSPAPVSPPPPAPVVPPALARPLVSGFGFSPRVIAVARRATPISALAKGGRFRYTLNRAARVTIAIQRKLAGRRKGRRCVRPTKRLRRNRRCARYQRRGALTRPGQAGPNTIAFSGRIGSRALAPGSYRATITATNTAGSSPPRRTTFKIVRPKRQR